MSYTFRWYVTAPGCEQASAWPSACAMDHHDDAQSVKIADQADCFLAYYRDKPATEVYVTGTFDNWKQSVKLEKEGDAFQKTVDLPSSSEKIYYKVRKAMDL